MKIAVYTIAKNEEQFVQRWYESAKEADLLYILDTGSTDKTVALAEELGIATGSLILNPWRFDHARNYALEAIPEEIDICIALDMDEVLIPGWREKLEKVDVKTTRPRYLYTWSWKADGSPDLVYGGSKIHSRDGYYWKHPVHETLIPLRDEHEEWIDLEIHHHPDESKSRGQYLPLLKLAVEEDPDDDRNAYYYARELLFKKQNKEAAKEFKRHLALPTAQWRPERAASMRYLAKLEPFQSESWLLRACAEAPDRREPWIELAQHYFDHNNFSGCFTAAQRAISITEKPLEYLCEDFAWGALPHDLAAISSFRLGLYELAITHGAQALSITPDDQRLQKNQSYYLNSASAGAK
jgi:tetratricopeptide (TPR) repeat protein